MIYNKFLLILFFLFLFPFLSNGQKQANHWYFGNKAGLNFNGTLSAIGNGQLNTQEGCSGYSDPHTGQLLFYCTGDTVWNKNNVPMSNGFGLGGHYSSTQSALVVPRPGSTTQFYIFTVGSWGGMQPTLSPGSFNLNLVDMTLNGGLGDVSIKNQVVLSPVCEKLTATLDCNGVDYWVVVHKFNSDKFYSYLLTSSGLSASPVISTIGIMHADSVSGNGFEAIGYMKISPDGKKLALACYANARTVEIFDFNNTTGAISNEILDTTWTNYAGFSGLYGVAFSPDNSKLYVSSIDSISLPNQVFQYDLNAGSGGAILASRIVINTSNNQYYGALQLAPNGKIYLAKAGSAYLDVINSPDNGGASCGFAGNGLQMGNSQGQHTSTFGLPNFIEIFNTPTQFKLTYDGCGGTYTATLLDTVIPFPVTVIWNFGDPASGGNNTSALFHPTHQFTSTGIYNVSLNITAGCTNFTYNIVVDLADSFQVDYGADKTLCNGDSVQLTNSFQYGSNYLWIPSTGLSCSTCETTMANPSVTTTYIVSIDDGPGCHDEDTIVVNVSSGVLATVSNDTSICPGASVQLIASGGSTYLWFNDPSLSSFIISNPVATPTQTSTYSVIVSLPGCDPDTASVIVTILSLPTVDAGPDLSIILGNSVLIDATSDGVSFLWQPGTWLNDSTILKPLAAPIINTTYVITVDNGLGCLAKDTVVILVNDGIEPTLYFPNAFSPNEDGTNDFFDYFNYGFDKVWMRIYNRWGEMVYETDLPHDGWDGTFDDLPCSMGVYVYYAVAADKGKNYFFKGNFTLIR